MPRGECHVRRVIQNSGVSLKILFPANKAIALQSRIVNLIKLCYFAFKMVNPQKVPPRSERLNHSVLPVLHEVEVLNAARLISYRA
jgi:hypothetical protein